MVFSNKGSLWIAGMSSPGEWPLPGSCWPVMSENFRSPLCSSRLLQPCLPHNFTLNFLSLLLRKVLKADKAFLCFTGYLFPQPRDIEWCISLHNFWRGIQWVQAGIVHPPTEPFSIGIVSKKPCPEMELHGKSQRAYPHVAVSWGLRNSPKHITTPPMDQKSAPPPCKVTGHSAGSWETCLAPKSTPVLNGRLCPQPQWSHPQRKHWAPKHFQAVNSWILLTRASSSIWEQIAAMPRSCLHRHPAHEASVFLHGVLHKTQAAGAMDYSDNLSHTLLPLHKCSFLA